MAIGNTRVLTLINQKGGCGKSSTCFHLAGAFAASGRRVLLIDADPQGSLSQGFLGSAEVEGLPASATIATLFDDQALMSAPAALVRTTSVPGIELAPANHFLAPFNTPAPESTGMRQYALREFIEALPGYDLVLIDCPPNLYLCSWTAMVAADFVLIPVPPEDFGTQGLRAVHQAIEQARTLNPNLRRLGHLITRADRRLLIHRTYEQRLRDLYQRLVLDTVVPEASAFKVAVACRAPVQVYAPGVAAAEAMRAVAAEILERMAASERNRRVA